METFFALPDGKFVCFNPGGRWHGWLFYRHPDGQFVSERKLQEVEPQMAHSTRESQQEGK